MSKLLLWMAFSHSLVWGQYVHPFGSPHFAQPQKIPSDYYLNLNREITLINSLKTGPTLGKVYAGKDWILFDYETYEENQSIDGFAPLKLLDKSKPVQASEILYFSNLSFSQLQGYGIFSGELFGSSYEAMLTDQTICPNELSMDNIISPANYVLFNEVEPFRSSFNSSLSFQTNNGSHSPKTDHNKSEQMVHNPKSLSFREVLGQYPTYTAAAPQTSAVYYNIFDTTSYKPFSSNNQPALAEKNPLIAEPNFSRISKQRRLTTYVWEMTDFSDYTKNNANDFLDITGHDGDALKIVLKPLSSGSVGTSTTENSSATQGVATNMPVSPDSGIWSPSTRTYNDFMKITGTPPSSISIDASAMKYYMNWYYGDWDISTDVVSANHYDLIYYSAVPEPSTYFMTGALFCLIGCNRSSRNVFNSIVSKAFNHWKTKPKCLDIQKRIS